MDRLGLINTIKQKKSFLCVGLDPELDKLPNKLKNTQDPIFEFNKAIIDATKDYCVAYKPNIAFYECLGTKGWDSLAKTLDYIPKNIFTIADAKRGDIGNTSKKYAQTFFTTYPFDAITVNPYMGKDSLSPYWEFPNKWVIALGLTSNTGAQDFQLQKTNQNQYFFEENIRKIAQWGTLDNTMFVVGATRGEDLQSIRKIIPQHFLLVPGVGAQGGSLADVVKHCLTPEVGLLINSSRGIIYAGNGDDFELKATLAAQTMQQEMQAILMKNSII